MNYIDLAKALDKVYNDFVEGKINVEFDKNITSETLAYLIEQFILSLQYQNINNKTQVYNVGD